MKKLAHSKKTRHNFPFFFAASILTVLALVSYLSFFSRAPLTVNEVSFATGVLRFALQPASLTLSPGDTTELTLTADAGGEEAIGFTAALTYPPEELEIISVTPGDFFTNILQPATWSNGQLTFTYTTPPGASGRSGSGTVANIKLRYKSGSPKLSFTTESLATADSYEGNAIRLASDASFNPLVVTSPSPSPSPSPVASPLSSPLPSPDPSPSQTISLKLDSLSCRNVTLAWTGRSGAQGYYLDLSKNNGFTNLKTSGLLNSSTNHYSFDSLDPSTNYYARLTVAGTLDFPHYGPTFEFTTPPCPASPTPQPSPTPSPILSASPSPTPQPSPTPTPTPTPTPNNFLQKIFKKASPTPTPQLSPSPSPLPLVSGSLNDIFPSPEPQISSEKPGFFREFFTWILSFFRKP